MSEERFSRQELWFGPEGQKIVESKKVAIVGVGGLGSHVAQQLAHLGVKDFSLIDPDKVDVSNLNRLIGANANDIGIEKVFVAERSIFNIQPTATVKTIPKDLRSQNAFRNLRECDIVFGCVDHDGPRFVLLEFCMAYRLPYFDLATDVPTADGGRDFGGRVILSVTEDSCLYCWGELSQEEIREYLSTEKQREVHRKIYGGGNSGPSPSVVSLNGITASIAVTEFLVQITGVRKAKVFLTYLGSRGIVTVRNTKDKLQTRCYYCETVKGSGDKSNVDRYIFK